MIKGDTAGRPPPGPVVPGAQEVPAGAISRANMASAAFCGWFATTRMVTSRTLRVRACGPYSDSDPITSMHVEVKGGWPLSRRDEVSVRFVCDGVQEKSAFHRDGPTLWLH